MIKANKMPYTDSREPTIPANCAGILLRLLVNKVCAIAVEKTPRKINRLTSVIRGCIDIININGRSTIVAVPCSYRDIVMLS